MTMCVHSAEVQQEGQGTLPTVFLAKKFISPSSLPGPEEAIRGKGFL